MRLILFLNFCRAFRAKPFQYIVDTAQRKSFRHLYYRRRDILEAECLVALFAMKMSVQIIDFARTAGAAYRIFKRPRPVVNAVYQVMRKEKSDGKYSGNGIWHSRLRRGGSNQHKQRRYQSACNRIQHIFQIEQRDGAACL